MGISLLGLAVGNGLIEVVDEATIRNRIGQLGEQLAQDFTDRQPVFVAILAGAVPFLADLVRATPIDLNVDFMALSRFGEGGRVRIAFDTELPLAGRHVVLVEDIVDTGLTLTTLRSMMEARGAASISAVTLIDKSVRRLVDVPVEYRGFETGDEFLLGYGLDWEGRFRNLRSLVAVMDMSLLTDPSLDAKVFETAGDNLPI